MQAELTAYLVMILMTITALIRVILVMVSITSEYGKLKIAVPRDRQDQFHNHLLPAYSRRQDVLETTIIQLYSKGVTTREITDLIEKMYGSYYSLISPLR
ncbi:MAG: transposase [Liquorilactobacillus sp.]|uniref:transposase n=1 Tax=Liquorilactobacillus nagelii TaxID=82688 RepID=UPI0039ECF2D1